MKHQTEKTLLAFLAASAVERQDFTRKGGPEEPASKLSISLTIYLVELGEIGV